MRDPLCGIIDDHRQQVGEYLIAPSEDDIAHRGCDVLAVSTLDAVGKQDGCLWLHPQPDCGRHPCGRRAYAAGARIAALVLEQAAAAGTLEGEIAGL
jgi:hypothetical protein